MAVLPGSGLAEMRFEAPHVRRGDIDRPALLERLPGGRREARITTVSAPAGWGKSTLLGQWIANSSPAVDIAYLGVDKADNDPLRFLGYLSAALSRVAPDLPFDEGAASVSQWIDTVLPGVAEAIGRRERPVAIALDDYHLVTNADVHRLIRSAIDDLASNAYLVVAGRADPPFPLARLRAAREVNDLRLNDLAFSAVETGTVLDAAYEVSLDSDGLTAFHTATEGWPAGVSLTGLSMASAPNPNAVASHIGGWDRHLADFFAEEVLENLDADLLDLMTCSSVLERFNVALLEAITEHSDAAGAIAEIERRQLFLLPLDPGRQWFRYHHMMADLLQVELARHKSGDEVAEIHLRAAEWLCGDGQIRPAVEQVFAAGAFERAAELVMAHGYGLAYDDRVHTVAEWCDRFPESIVDEHPDLCMLGVFTRRNLGQDAAALAWLDRYEAIVTAPTPTQQIAVLDARAWLNFAAGQLVKSATYGEQILAVRPELPNPDSPEATAATDVLNGTLNAGLALLQVGDGRAIQLLQEVLDVPHRSPSIDLQYEAAAGTLALHHWGRYEDRQAHVKLQAAQQRCGDRKPHVFSVPWVTAAVLLDPGAIDDQFINRLTALTEYYSSPHVLALALAAEARHLQAHDQSSTARIALGEAHELLSTVERSAAINPIIDRATTLVEEGSEPMINTPVTLTDREQQILGALTGPLTQREIGAELYLSFNTVKTYTRTLYRKLGVQSRSQALQRARDLQLLP